MQYEMNGPMTGNKTILSRVTRKVIELGRSSSFLYLLALIATFAAGFYLRPVIAGTGRSTPEQPGVQIARTEEDRKTPSEQPAAAPKAEGESLRCQPGPWGNLEYVPITFAAPAELTTVQSFMDNKPQWFFKDYSYDDLVEFLRFLDLPAGQVDRLLESSVMTVHKNGIVISPPQDVLIKLPSQSRERIFKLLSRFPENNLTYFNARSLDERLHSGGVSKESAELFKQLSCQNGDYRVVSGMAYILASLPTDDERAKLIKVMSQQKSVLIRLRITPDTDIAALTKYWDKAGDMIDVKALLEAMVASPNGATLDLVKLLPSLPASLIYTFPKLHNTKPESPVRRDCHWTAFNFFNETADDRYGDSDFIEQKFKTEYEPISDQPHYGDLIFLTRPDGSVIHSAVHIADNIVYTKNGVTAATPWMFATISDLIELYAFAVDKGQKVTVKYFRKKSP